MCHNSDQQEIFSWIKPPIGVLKCNIDASFFNNNSLMEYGACVRDSLVQFVAATIDFVPALISILREKLMPS